jgi:hypothetical protein
VLNPRQLLGMPAGHVRFGPIRARRAVTLGEIGFALQETAFYQKKIREPVLTNFRFSPGNIDFLPPAKSRRGFYFIVNDLRDLFGRR